VNIRSLFKTRYVRLLERELFRARLTLRRKEQAWERERKEYVDYIASARNGRPVHREPAPPREFRPRGYQPPDTREYIPNPSPLTPQDEETLAPFAAANR
jgi:hypothetical protein